MSIAVRHPSLAGHSVVVTGGANGIGAALVRAFAVQGARVGFVDLNAERGQALAGELNAAGHEVAFAAADLTDIDALKRAFASLEAANGPARTLVNNAAMDDRHDWRTVTTDYFDRMIAVNLRHQFFAIQAVAPGMIAAGGGSIINFSSTVARLKTPDVPLYTMSKTAILGLTRSFARELGAHSIRVNAILPGWVLTERQEKLWLSEEGDKARSEGQMLPGWIMPDDLAGMVLLLASDEGRMITAQEFVIDAGWS